jgi:hypothetical protein
MPALVAGICLVQLKKMAVTSTAMTRKWSSRMGDDEK